MIRPREEPGPEPNSDGITNPFETLSLDVLHHMFVVGGFTVRELRGFCSASKQLENACRNEYVWLKMYFVKVIGDTVLPTLREHKIDSADETTR